MGGILHIKVDTWPVLVPVTATAAYNLAGVSRV